MTLSDKNLVVFEFLLEGGRNQKMVTDPKLDYTEFCAQLKISGQLRIRVYCRVVSISKQESLRFVM